jgi:hypothetical protein
MRPAAATKSEISNPKSETNSKLKIQMSQTTLTETSGEQVAFTVSPFVLRHYSFVSGYFAIRHLS